ncbi:hypothetical protein D1P53_005797 [Cryptococcus gattii VGV]|nr:hypothetical protein D1P53_005797 [Cryptococcus gattii VGV]
MTVIIHSLADAPHRHPPTRSPSSVTLPPISTLIPAASLPTRATKSSPPKLSSRDQTLLSKPSLKGWSLYPLQGLQLDKRYPEWSIHGWHEDAQRLLQPPQAMIPSNVYAKLRPISLGSYSSESHFDKSFRAHPPPGWGKNMDSTSQMFASIQAKTIHHLPLRPINSEAKLSERSYRFITYGTELTEQENHAMARALDNGKESSGSRTNVGQSASGKMRSIAFAPNTPPCCHPTKSIVLCTENEWSSSISKSTFNHPASRLNVTTYRSDFHQSSHSPVAPKAAFEEDELDSTSSSSSCSSELSEYEDNDDFESSDMSYRGRERSRAALVYGGMDCREIIEQDESGEDLPIKFHLKVPHLSSILGSSPIKSIDSENVTPSSSNYTPTSNTKRARTLNSTSTSSPMPLSSWGEERGNEVLKNCISANEVECTDNTGGKVTQKEQRRNRERRREQNAMAQKKFRWKKKQMAEKQQGAYDGTIGQMAADLESANATTSKLQKQLAERDSLVSDLQSELSLYKRKFGERTLI